MRTRTGSWGLGTVTAVILVMVAVACVPNPRPRPTTTTTTTTSTSTTTSTAAPTLCVPGTFSATGSTPCTPAPAGSYVDTAGATTANLCAQGFFQDIAGSTSCTAAPIGFYVDTVGAVAATACPANYTTTSTGSVASSACIQVPAFTWVVSGAPSFGIMYTSPMDNAATGSISGTATLNCSGNVFLEGRTISFYRGTGVFGAGGFYPDFIGNVLFPQNATCGTAYPVTANGTWTFSPGDQIAVLTQVAAAPAVGSVSISLQGPLGAGPTQVLGTLTP